MKKILLTTASAVLSLGILAACGDDGIDEPTLGEDQDFEQEMEFDETEGTEDVETDLDVDFNETEESEIEFDTELGEEQDETEEDGL